jgi:hypothetical protein
VVECAGHKRPYRSSEADALALTGFTFGLDIVLFVIPLIYATRSQHRVLARASYREGLRLRQEMHQVEQRLGIVKGLAGLTEMAAAQRQAERAGRLFGPAARLLPATTSSREEVHRCSVATRARLDAATYEVG